MNKVIGMILLLTCALAQAERHGEIRTVDQQQQAYLANESRWVTPEAFWESHGLKNKNRHWRSSSTYPPYNEVNEFDTFIVQLDSGSCLMEFFHSRWRRANDVRRWDPQFNEHSGCPDVFK